MLEDKSEGKLTGLHELGEIGIIERIKRNVPSSQKGTVLGIGDDAAALECGDGKLKLVSTDLLIENVHFDMVYTPAKHLGYKAVVVNVSDIAAMGGTPQQITVSLALSSRYTVEFLDEFYRGVLLACKKYNVDLIGGDTSSAPSGLAISITAIGECDKEELLKRDGAKNNDLICVTGDLGGAFVGLNILEREKRIFIESPQVQPDLGSNHYAIERQLKPEARTDINEILKGIGVKPTSMIDLSDGLAPDVRHICKASGTGCSIYEDKLPIDPQVYNTARELNLDPTICMLNGGEDYELLFTVAQSDFEKVKNHPDISVVGHMTDKNSGCNLIGKSGNQHELKAQGWDSFKE